MNHHLLLVTICNMSILQALGIGYTSTSFTATSGNVERTFKDTTFVDLSYTIGSEMTAQFVLGSVIGQGPVATPTGDVENTSKSGTAIVTIGKTLFPNP